MLRNLGLLGPELETAGTGDLMSVVETDDSLSPEDALERIQDLFARKKTEGGGARQTSLHSITAAKATFPEANLAVIAVNGAYAAREARNALESGLHVMMFRFNV